MIAVLAKDDDIILDIKSWLMMFQMKMKTLWGIRGHSCYMLATNMPAFFHAPRVLEAEFKGERLCLLAWLLLAASSQIYWENKEYNTKVNI